MSNDSIEFGPPLGRPCGSKFSQIVLPPEEMFFPHGFFYIFPVEIHVKSPRTVVKRR